MKTLSAGQVKYAEIFLRSQARPLEWARYAHHFWGEPARNVFIELRRFVNPDGGFGHGLEADLRVRESSVICTTVALQICSEIGATEQAAEVRGAFRYLQAALDPDAGVWPIVPPVVEQAPHAPWWTWDEDLASRWNGFRANPRAEIVGYLHQFPGLFKEDVRDSLTREVVEQLDEMAPSLEMHELLCYVRLVETANLSADVRETLVAKLRPVVQRAVATDPSQWFSYGLQPLWVASTPQSPFAEQLGDAVQANLDYLTDAQGNDGAWAPNWDWGGKHPKVWRKARIELKGVLTLRNLRALDAWGRLEKK